MVVAADLPLDGWSSILGRGCVKTSFKSKSAANPPDFRKLQLFKALISLKLKFWRLDFNHDLIRSLTFSHSLGQKSKSGKPNAMPALHLIAGIVQKCKGNSIFLVEYRNSDGLWK